MVTELPAVHPLGGVFPVAELVTVTLVPVRTMPDAGIAKDEPPTAAVPPPPGEVGFSTPLSG